MRTSVTSIAAGLLAEKQGCSIAHAQGFLDGESARREGLKPSRYAILGTDDYARGFCAGYFERLLPEDAKIQMRAPRSN